MMGAPPAKGSPGAQGPAGMFITLCYRIKSSFSSGVCPVPLIQMDQRLMFTGQKATVPVLQCQSQWFKAMHLASAKITSFCGVFIIAI